MWLAAENGMFLRSTKGEWMTTMPEHLTMDWVESIKVRGTYSYDHYICTHRHYIFTQPKLIGVLGNSVSMFSSISLKELRDHILNVVRLHLYGTISMQVSRTLTFSLPAKLRFLYYLLFFPHSFYFSVDNLRC